MRTLLDRWWSLRALILLCSATIVVLAATLTPSTEAVSIFGFEVPPLCLWRNLTGWSCFGCGLTRSFTFLAHGHLEAAIRMNVLGPLLFLAVACQLPYQVYRIAVEARERRAA